MPVPIYQITMQDIRNGLSTGRKLPYLGGSSWDDLAGQANDAVDWLDENATGPVLDWLDKKYPWIKELDNQRAQPIGQMAINKAADLSVNRGVQPTPVVIPTYSSDEVSSPVLTPNQRQFRGGGGFGTGGVRSPEQIQAVTDALRVAEEKKAQQQLAIQKALQKAKEASARLSIQRAQNTAQEAQDLYNRLQASTVKIPPFVGGMLPQALPYLQGGLSSQALPYLQKGAQIAGPVIGPVTRAFSGGATGGPVIPAILSAQKMISPTQDTARTPEANGQWATPEEMKSTVSDWNLLRPNTPEEDADWEAALQATAQEYGEGAIPESAQPVQSAPTRTPEDIIRELNQKYGGQDFLTLLASGKVNKADIDLFDSIRGQLPPTKTIGSGYVKFEPDTSNPVAGELMWPDIQPHEEGRGILHIPPRRQWEDPYARWTPELIEAWKQRQPSTAPYSELMISDTRPIREQVLTENGIPEADWPAYNVDQNPQTGNWEPSMVPSVQNALIAAGARDAQSAAQYATGMAKARADSRRLADSEYIKQAQSGIGQVHGILENVSKDPSGLKLRGIDEGAVNTARLTLSNPATTLIGQGGMSDIVDKALQTAATASDAYAIARQNLAQYGSGALANDKSFANALSFYRTMQAIGLNPMQVSNLWAPSLMGRPKDLAKIKIMLKLAQEYPGQ